MWAWYQVKKRQSHLPPEGRRRWSVPVTLGSDLGLGRRTNRIRGTNSSTVIVRSKRSKSSFWGQIARMPQLETTSYQRPRVTTEKAAGPSLWWCSFCSNFSSYASYASRSKGDPKQTRSQATRARQAQRRFKATVGNENGSWGKRLWRVRTPYEWSIARHQMLLFMGSTPIYPGKGDAEPSEAFKSPV